MKKRLLILLSGLIVLGMALAACSPASESNQSTPGNFPTLNETQPGGTPLTGATQASQTNPTQAATEGAILPETGAQATVAPPAVQGTSSPIRGARVAGDRAQVTRLSPLMDFQVVDKNGNSIGRVDDYVLNLCEAHIIYVLVDGNGNGEMQGSQFLIPYEVVTLDNGAIDAGQHVIVLNLDASDLTGVPTVSGELNLQDTSWETDVRSFWSNFVTLSGLTTGCRVPASGKAESSGNRVNITRIALASQMLGAQVVDGNGDPVGQVEEIVLTPESGLLRFAAVRLDDTMDAQGFAMVPMGGLNIRQENTNGEVVLELLVERSVLKDSPLFDAVPTPQDASWENPAFQYWSQYVPLTREQLSP